MKIRLPSKYNIWVKRPGSVIHKCSSLATYYFNNNELQKEYHIDEYVKMYVGINPAVNKCISLATKYFNDTKLHKSCTIRQYIKANAKDTFNFIRMEP